MKDRSISVDQARYATYIVSKYLDTATVRKIKKVYKITLASDMILTKSYAFTCDEKVDNLSREFTINYRACIRSFIYLLSTRLDLSFAVHKLENLS